MTTINLPEKLSQYVDVEKLRDNAQNYEVMHTALTNGEQLAAAAIRTMLLDIDLSHATRKPLETFFASGILPETAYQDNNIHYTNTLPLDRSLGLDHYTFMHWGGFIRKGTYGKNVIRISTPNILLSPNTIVSPKDISSTIFSGRMMSYGALEGDEKKRAENYLDSLVTGVDWLEITARKALQRVKHEPSMPDLYTLHNPGALGEIKHFGVVSPDCFTGTITDETEETAAWKKLVEQGFTIEPVSHAIEAARYGRSTCSSYDRTPEQIGANVLLGEQQWQHIRDLAHS